MGRTGRGGSSRSLHEQHHRSSGRRGRGGGRKGWVEGGQAEALDRCEQVAGPQLLPHLPRAPLSDGGGSRGAAAARCGQRGGERGGEGGRGGGVRALLREAAVRTAARTKRVSRSAAEGGGRGGSAGSKERGGPGERGRGGAWRVPVEAGGRRVSERFAGSPSGGLRVAGGGCHARDRRAQSGHSPVRRHNAQCSPSPPHHPHTPSPHPPAPFPESSGPVSSSTAASIRS